ncbi:flavodoxin [Noviherbaspirillum sedimenti]|uniref:Flavodoxin n=2 Tax=Noviherbaspirillum sedimenti TaxID=2320865 RepID=A0A3A3FZD3_9BURK|nr:flavodoxin [Noviherbaspirillum sedimenti]
MLLPIIADTKVALAAQNAGQSNASQRSAGNILVAFFSRSGNTRVIAGQIHRALGTALYEIQPATPYPDDYEQAVEQARKERDSGYRPALKESVPNMASYKTIFLGFPIWGETAPPVIRAFLASHDLAGKTLIPFITHGGYGLGSSLSVVAAHAPKARLLDAGFTMQADQERQTLTRVTSWLEKIKTK